MAKFDGQTGITVPESVLSSETFPPHKFTIATWMRHRDNKALDKHTKEHIICKADDHRESFITSIIFWALFFVNLHSCQLFVYQIKQIQCTAVFNNIPFFLGANFCFALFNGCKTRKCTLLVFRKVTNWVNWREFSGWIFYPTLFYNNCNVTLHKMLLK